MDILNSLISASSGLLGVLIGYRAAKKQNLLEAKRDAYGAVISNLYSNFRFRELEETDRILGKALALAEPTLQSLLEDYRWIMEVYRTINKHMRGARGNSIPQEWRELDKIIFSSRNFHEATKTIKLLMRKELEVEDSDNFDIIDAQKLFLYLKKEIEKANIPLSINSR